MNDFMPFFKKKNGIISFLYSKSLLFLMFMLSIMTSCSWKPQSIYYQEQYKYLEMQPKEKTSLTESTEYFIVFLVDAKHLDYTNSQTFLKTFTKHPSTGNKECNVGHAWIYLKGMDKNNKSIVIEGGHSGELGVSKLRYVDGISLLAQNNNGNPISYLWEPLNDGFFQQGNGGHNPTFAAKVNLTKQQFWDIYTFIHPKNYPYKEYSLTARQCASFIAQIAALLDICIESEVTLPINQYAFFLGQKIPLWTDSRYSEITFSSPDIIEKSLFDLVSKGHAESVKYWYLKKTVFVQESCVKKITSFPKRLYRHLSIL